jgi:hypothetical protein
MGATQTSNEMNIHGVAFKVTLPQKILNQINTQKRSSMLIGKEWMMGMIKFIKTGNQIYLNKQWNEIYPFIVSMLR